MVDFLCNAFGKPFVVKEDFTEDGIYFERKERDGSFGIHNRFQIWNGEGLLAAIHNFRGAEEATSKKYAAALSHFAKAIALNPKFVKAYTNRAMIYAQLGEQAASLADSAKAVELDPKSAEAYWCRGHANLLCEENHGSPLGLHQIHRTQCRISAGIHSPKRCYSANWANTQTL